MPDTDRLPVHPREADRIHGILDQIGEAFGRVAYDGHTERAARKELRGEVGIQLARGWRFLIHPEHRDRRSIRKTRIGGRQIEGQDGREIDPTVFVIGEAGEGHEERLESWRKNYEVKVKS